MVSIPNPPPPPKQAIAKVKEYLQYASDEHKQLINKAIQLLSRPLGDAAKLERVRNAWNITGAGEIATATNGITQGRLELAPLWSGPAAIAFNNYSITLIGQSNAVRTALNAVGTALTDVHQQVYQTIVDVSNAMLNCGIAIIKYLENNVNSTSVDLLSVIGKTTGAILGLLASLATEFAKLWAAAITQIGMYRKNLNAAMTSIANLGKNPVATLPGTAADPGQYTPVKRPSS